MDMKQAFEDLCAALIANDTEYSLQRCDELLSANPNDIEIWLGRGVLLRKSKNYKEAVENYTHAVSISSGEDLVNALIGRALSHYELGHFQKALKDCDQSLSMISNKPSLLQFRALLLIHLNRNLEALKTFDEILSLNPNDANTIEIKEELISIFQRNLYRILEETEKAFCEALKIAEDELKDRWKYGIDELEKSDECLRSCIDAFRSKLQNCKTLFESASAILQVQNQCFAAYYHIKAMESGLNAIYPSLDEKKFEESRLLFVKAGEYAEKDDDSRRSMIINNMYSVIQERAYYESGKINNEQGKSSASGLNTLGLSNKLIALGVGTFGIVLLISGQWLGALPCFGIAWWLWQT